MVNYHSFPLEGGAEKQGRLLAMALREKGVDVICVAARLKGMPAYELRGGVPVHRVGAIPWKWKGMDVVDNLVYPRLLRRFLLHTGKNYDVFHCHGAFDVSAASVVLTARRMKKVSLVKHASTDEFTFLKSVPFGRGLEATIRGADAFVGSSVAVYEAMTRKYGLPEARCFRIANGIPDESRMDQQAARQRLGLPADWKIAVIVASFGPGKNQRTAIRAWEQVLGVCPEARLILLGDGSEKTLCQELARELRIADRVLFLGRRIDVGVYLDASDLFLFPSLKEGMSNAVLEAMVHAVPCAVSDIPGNRALITAEKEGLVFDPTDSTVLADSVTALFRDPSLARTLGRAARERVLAEHGMCHVAERYFELYARLIKAHPN